MRIVKVQLRLKVQWAKTDKEAEDLAKWFISGFPKGDMCKKGNVALLGSRIVKEKKGELR